MGTVEFGKKIVEYTKEMCKGEDAIVFSPNIRVDLTKIIGEVDPKELIFATNGNLFAGKKNTVGFAVDHNNLYYRNDFEDARIVGWNDVKSVSFHGKNRFGSFSPGDSIIIETKTGFRYEMKSCLTGCDCKKVLNTLEYIISQDKMNYNELWEYRLLSLDELPEELISVYMKVLYNYIYIDDGTIDTKEYAAVRSIGVRLGLKSKVRNDLRTYALDMDSRIKTGVLLNTLKGYVSFGTYELIRFSLLQDLLYLSAITEGKPNWENDQFISRVQSYFEVNNQKMKCMEIAISLFEKLQKKDVNDIVKIENEIKKNCKMAEVLGIPRESLFCSGGLYTVDKYKIFFKKKSNQRSIQFQRELILQSVIENQQKSLNQVSEDLNDTTVKLIEMARKGNERDIKIEQMSEKFVQISKMYRDKSIETEHLLLVNRVLTPITIDEMNQLSSAATLKKFYHLDDGRFVLNNDISENEYRLIERLRGEFYEG